MDLEQDLPSVIRPSGGGGAWGKLYEVDFTTQTPFGTVTPGTSVVIDGKTWWVKGQTTATPGGLAYASLVAGKGLRIDTNFSISYPHGSFQDSFGRAATKYLHWFMPLAQFAKVDLTRPLALQCRISNETGAGSQYALCGFCDNTNDQAELTGGPRAGHMQAVASGNNGATTPLFFVGWGNGKQAAGSTNGVPQSSALLPTGTAPNQAGAMLELIRATPDASFATAKLWSGSYPSPETVQIADATNNYSMRGILPAAPVNLGIYFFPQDQAGGASRPYDLLSMCLWQPGA